MREAVLVEDGHRNTMQVLQAREDEDGLGQATADMVKAASDLRMEAVEGILVDTSNKLEAIRKATIRNRRVMATTNSKAKARVLGTTNSKDKDRVLDTTNNRKADTLRVSKAAIPTASKVDMIPSLDLEDELAQTTSLFR
jgi:hypothetical protein